METKEKVTAKIIALTMQIQEEYPELLTFVDEMKITIPNETNPEINIRILNEYYDTLNQLLKKQFKKES